MRKLFLIFMALIACSLGLSAQTHTYQGTVVDAATSEPLPGATVMPIGGGQGAATDIDGKFEIAVPANVTEVQVSYVGYASQKVHLSKDMVIRLQSSSETLQDVMVVAYGTSTKEAFTGSAAVINADQIENSQVNNALNALSGRVAGVQLTNLSGQPGSTTPTIRIRGISSLNAGNSPLVVVDGAPYPGDINNINPSDIASMTLLKDAASNALYGARGANGVILITTKKGKRGEGMVNIDAKWGGNSRATQDYETIRDPRQYYELYYSSLYNYAKANGFNDARAYQWAASNLTANNDYGLRYQTYTAPDGQYLIGSNGKFNPAATPGYLRTYRGETFYMQADNWMDYAYDTSLRQEYNVNVSNGNEKNNFYLSVGYLDNEGIVPNSDYKRLTGRLTADSQVKDFLKVGGNVNYTHYSAKSMSEDGQSNSSANIFAAATEVAPVYPLFMRDADGNVMVDSNGITRYDYGDGLNGGWERPAFGNSNAFSSALYDANEYEGNAFGASGFAEIRFLNDFKFTSNNSVNIDERRTAYFTNPYYGSYASSNGMITRYHTRRTSYNFQQLLNWSHKFGQHDVTVLVGHENYWNKYTSLSANRSNMFDPTIFELDGAVTAGESGSYTSEYNNEGWLFRAQYNYSEKYFGSVSVRRDASSRFHPDHRWGTFWSAGAAWIISKEEWFHAPWVNLLKIKASYGEQGNDNIDNFLYTNTYNIVNGSGQPAATPATMGNPDISWEKNGNFNAGVEFEFFNSRLNGSVEAFYRKTSDMLSWFTLPPSFGYTGYWANIGDMKNTGVEIDLQGTIISTRNFTWNVNANLTWYKNELAYLPEERKGQTIDGVRGYSSGEFFYGEGEPLYTYRMYKYAGPNPETGEAMYYKRATDKDGKETLTPVTYNQLGTSDYFLCGTALPSTYGGFGTTLEAYGFDLSVDFNYSIGGQFYDSQYAMFMAAPTANSRGYNMHADVLKAWTPENPNTDVPRLQYGDNYNDASSDRFLTDASYLSLQNINFGYTLPKSVTDKLCLDKLRFYFAAENLWVWSKRQGTDPRQSIAGSVNNTYYAPMRTLSGGIQVSF